MKTTQQRALFTACSPILNVANVVASIKYYCDKLGFEINFAWSPDCSQSDQSNPEFAQVSRGQFSLMLAEQDQGGAGMWIYLDLASPEALEALYQEYLASGAKIAKLPTDQSWDMREMLVEDLDGHTLRIGASIHD